MRHFKILTAALGAALLVAACGGGGDGNQAPAVAYSSVVSFGDSLSDAGSYKVGPVAALGGGQFTVNGIAGTVGANPVPSYAWVQLVSAAAVGKISCAARTGGFGVAETVIAGCTDYAQGGSRVSAPVGPGNKGKTGSIFNAAMTEPVSTQIDNYLADGGALNSTQLFTVLAGANDLFGQTDLLTTNATTQGNNDFPVELGKLLLAGISPAVTDPAVAAADVTTIATAFATVVQGGGSLTSGVLAAVHAAVLMGNATVLDVAVVIASAQADATNPAKVGAAIAAAAAMVPPVTLTQTQAGGQVFVTSLTTQLVADIPAAKKAAAATAIPGAFSAAYAAALTAGKSASDAQTTAVGAAVQAAADGGNAKVSAILGTTDKTVVGAVATATSLANQFAVNWAGTVGAKQAVDGMAAAATALIAQVNRLTAGGATHVVVVNLPDVSQTPMAMAQDASSRGLVLAMTNSFNQTLQAGVVGKPGILFVDVFAENQRQLANPGHYSLTNVKDVACKLTSPDNAFATTGKADGSSLVCNSSNVIAGDTSHYLFADNVHPTPYGHKLFAQYVTKALVLAGWL